MEIGQKRWVFGIGWMAQIGGLLFGWIGPKGK
jgi:hypothetical protein